MPKLSELFSKCDHGIRYQTAGNDVNYAFEEDIETHTLTIYFQGSSSTTDWVRNFLFKKKPYKDMEIPYRVHRGFLEAWKEVEDIIIDKIIEKKYPDTETEICDTYKWKHIVVVGYSHGGSLAFFATECVWFYRPDLRDGGFESYAFESPRVYGNYFIKDELKERWANMTVIRIGSDLVTHCPPAIFGFCHAGKLLKIPGNYKLVNKKIPRCIKYHFPEVVYDALLKYENGKEDK